MCVCLRSAAVLRADLPIDRSRSVEARRYNNPAACRAVHARPRFLLWAQVRLHATCPSCLLPQKKHAVLPLRCARDSRAMSRHPRSSAGGGAAAASTRDAAGSTREAKAEAVRRSMAEKKAQFDSGRAESEARAAARHGRRAPAPPSPRTAAAAGGRGTGSFAGAPAPPPRDDVGGGGGAAAAARAAVAGALRTSYGAPLDVGALPALHADSIVSRVTERIADRLQAELADEVCVCVCC